VQIVRPASDGELNYNVPTEREAIELPTPAVAEQRSSPTEDERRVVTFQAPSDSPTSAATTAAARPNPRRAERLPTRFSVISQAVTGRSAWRFPDAPGEMPCYMQKKFRVKTYCLMGIQLAIMLGIM
ncbi:unnamed protein product, partial [Polarella glacialis]